MVDFADGLPLEFYGNLESCQLRYPTLTAGDIKYFNYHEKTFTALRNYTERGVYTVKAEAFDIRNYVETTLQITVFKMFCNTPKVFIPQAFVDTSNIQLAPEKFRSNNLEFSAVSNLVCNESVITYKSWRLFGVSISQVQGAIYMMLNDDTEVFGSTGSVGTGHFVRYSRKSVILDIFNVKFVISEFRFILKELQ